MNENWGVQTVNDSTENREFWMNVPNSTSTDYKRNDGEMEFWQMLDD
jgi:hypothetical protein